MPVGSGLTAHSPAFYLCLEHSLKPSPFKTLFTSLGFPINQTTSLPLLAASCVHCLQLATSVICSKESVRLIMPGPWDHETDRKLLLCLVDPNLKPKWVDVASDMGSGFTSESVRYVFWKIVE